MNCNRDLFVDRAGELNEVIDVHTKSSSRLSILRLIIFILTVLSYIVSYRRTLFIIPSILLTIVFVSMLIIHGRIKRELKRLQTIRVINSDYISRIDGDLSSLSDGGKEFMIDGHAYAGDLDVFGDASLFALYNLSDTFMGRREFADRLLNDHIDDVSDAELEARQKAVSELISDPVFLQEYQAVARLGKITSDPAAFRDLASTEKNFDHKRRIMYYLQPLLWVPSVIMAVIGFKYYSAAILITLVVNLIIWFFASSAYTELFSRSGGIARQTGAISDLYKMLEEKEFSSELINGLIKGEGDVAVSVRLKRLSRALTLIGFRGQPILALLLNSILPFDLFCADRLLCWSRDNGRYCVKALDNIGDIEALMSSACVGIISSQSVFPKFVRGAVFDGRDICHPLIKPDKVVSNSVRLDSQIALITGSNMSGKTTLIRTVGICTLLAMTGAPVPASSVTLGRMRIMSSMRIVDSLEGNMSTFKAELVRIAGIIKASADTTPMLFLIDEIFRGTNSTDRTEGAMSVLVNLSKSHIIGMMTTHDYALCDKVEQTLQNIVYYHFSETYNDTGISFDYKLHNGVSHESNAKYLMRLVGIT